MGMTDDDMKDTCTINRIEPENADITSVFIEGYGDKFRQRKAGQYLTLKIMQDDQWSEAHPFTISCAPGDPLLRLTIKRAGAFTSAIPTLKKGDRVKCAGPYGVFCRDIENRPDIVMIAGGVGITPFLSVLRHFHNNHARNRVLLLWSNKTIDDAFARDELNGMTRVLQLNVLYSLSREQDAHRYADDAYPSALFMSGRITEDVLRDRVSSKDQSFYLCGPPPMQEFILSQLGEFGIDAASVEKEKFSW
ncbi:MAG TPA: FAD/NAD-binding family oxidoreductase [Deltaproteobacteria bacterium]|nr:FAD/NAD-binding family oxidoreductase [Deltaproteobacteria bacterium]